MSKVKDIIRIIEDFAPLHLQEDYDNCGLLIGDREGVVRKALITLDVTLDAMDQAVAEGVEMIISHHPIIFSPIKDITLDDVNGVIITRAIKNNIAIYSAHTNVDNAVDSIAREFAVKLGCSNIIPLDFTCGVVADLGKTVTMAGLIDEVGDILGDNAIKSIGDLKREIDKIVFANGANGGNDELIIYACKNADVLITSEVKHHIAVTAKDIGLNIIECGHYESESLFMELIDRKIKECISDVDFIIDKTSISPYNS